MIVSEARLEANRRNARCSTGPKTEAGKARSRRNALTHGLSASLAQLPEEDAAGSETEAKPADPGLDWPAWLAGQLAEIASRLGRADRLERAHRERVALRAELSWGDDRRLEAEALGARLGLDPAGVAGSLRMTPQGCDWLIERWSLLARAADLDGGWTPEQRSLAFDLLGRPSELRGGEPGDSPEIEATSAPGLGPAALARREVAALLLRKVERARLDDFDRAQARAGTSPDDADPALRKLRRHEADLHRRLRWVVAQPKPPAEAPKPAPETPRPLGPPPRSRIDLDVEPITPDDDDEDPVALYDALVARRRALAAIVPPNPPAPADRPAPGPLNRKARRAARTAADRGPSGRKTNPTRRPGHPLDPARSSR